MAYMISTNDNPYDPRLNFKSWYMWDVEQGYNTSSYLARVAVVAEAWPQVVQDKNIEEAIDEIISIHNGEIYIKLKVDEELVVSLTKVDPNIPEL